MLPKHKELQDTLDKLVAFIKDNLEQGWSKEMAATKLHELVWWMQKSEIDSELAKKDPRKDNVTPITQD